MKRSRGHAYRNTRLGEPKVWVPISREKVCCPTPMCKGEFNQLVLDEKLYVWKEKTRMSGIYIRWGLGN